MARWARLLVLAILILVAGGPAARSGAAPVAQFDASERLVVFEGFFDPNCPRGQAAGQTVDAMAETYAGQPVLFLEYDIRNLMAFPERNNRFWAANGIANPVNYMMVMVDSGQQYYTVSDEDKLNPLNVNPAFYQDDFQAMVTAQQGRDPKAEINMFTRHEGDTLMFETRVKNLSGVDLSPDNLATIHYVVFEVLPSGPGDPPLAGTVTHRIVRFAHSVPVTLANGATSMYAYTTPAITGVDWANTYGVVLLDYKPAMSARYDMLQAALDGGLAVELTPSPLEFRINPFTPVNVSQQMTVSGAPSWATWSVTGAPTWLTVTPSSGAVKTSASVQVIAADLSPGQTLGTITITLTTPDLKTTEAQVAVQVDYPELKYLYLPLAKK